MTAVACSLVADELAAQLDRYRALGRHVAAVDHEPGRIRVRFSSDPPAALIERTLEVERGCCPFLVIDYEPATQRLSISVDQTDRRPSLDAIARALGESPAADLLPDSAQGQTRTAPGIASCCSSSALETCCEPQDKQACCVQTLTGASPLAAPPSCGCNA
jgi:hypothetical protein